MIHIFNRAELLVTPDVSLQARVCQSLAASGMEYTVRVVNRAAPPGGFGSRARTRTPSGGGAGQYLYYIYVKRSDLEAASGLARRD